MLDGSCIIDYYSRKGMKEGGELKNKMVTAADIGAAVRKKRKEDGLTLADAAALCGVGYRFMSDLENGKATVQVGKVLQVLTALGLDVTIEARKWPNE
jgi:HTH-type transcriptional regulator / antitoxin HipB